MKQKSSLEILKPSLEVLDRLETEDLVLGLFQDERPLRGVAGLVDWRLCGMLSRFAQLNRVTGEVEERVLMPGAGRIGPQRIFLLGLGKRTAYDQRLPEVTNTIVDILKRAKTKRVALALPGPSRVVAPHLETLCEKLGKTVEVVLDDDGMMSEWLHR